MNFRSKYRLMACVVLTLCTYMVGSQPASATPPPNPNVIVEVQPDGQRISLIFKGGAKVALYEDIEGFPVIRLESGLYVYQQNPDPGVRPLLPEFLEVGKVDPKAIGIKQLDVSDRQSFSRPPPALVAPLYSGDAPRRIAPVGTVKNLVVPIRFADHANRPLPSRADFDVLFNAPGGDASLAPTGSIRDLYLENSYGQLTLESTVLDWHTAPNTEAYYANGESGLGTKIWEAIRSSLDSVDASLNFADFDQDGDGFIDAITFIHSGYAAEFGGTDSYGAASTSRIWSHKWRLQPSWLSDEGVAVGDYNINPGVWSTSGSAIGRIGVIAHELGHFFGLPDLYDTNGGGSGLGSWGLMANSWGFTGTQYNPPHLSAYSKIQLGWTSPIPLSIAGNYSLDQSETSASVFRIDKGFPSGEYLLLENRQPTGTESTMPQGGLVVWHVDEAMNDNRREAFPGNSTWPSDHYRVAVLQADGLYDLEKGNNRGDRGDAYHPGSIASISPSTVPSTDAYQGGSLSSTGIAIDVTSNGSTLGFDFGLPPPAPTFVRPTGIETFTIDSVETVQWNTNGAPSNTTYKLESGDACSAGIFFTDDMESGDAAWNVSEGGTGNNAFWSLKTGRAQSGTTSWFVPNSSTASDEILETATTVEVPIVDPRLEFSHFYQTEAAWDGGVIEASADGGSTWVDLGSRMTASGYNGTLNGGILSGRAAFTGSSGSFVKTVVDLTDFSGQNVAFRFRFGSDGSVSELGWYVDDVVVSGGGTSTRWSVIADGIESNIFDWTVNAPVSNDRCLRLMAYGPDGDSRPVYSELFEVISGEAPEILLSDGRTTLAGDTDTFQFSANGTQVSQWWLYLGSSRGDKDIYDSGNITSGSNETVDTLPTDGSTVFARLFFRASTSATWQRIDATFQSAVNSGVPTLVSPASGTTLAGTDEDFTWSANGVLVDQWWLYVGSTFGGRQYFDSGNIGSASGVSATGLPADGSIVNVRLWYRVSGRTWRYVDETYASGPGPLPGMERPTPGSVLSDTSVTFFWADNGTSVDEWWLYVGSIRGGAQYLNSGALGSAESVTATGLPSTGSVVYVRLWYRENGGRWSFVDAEYSDTGTAS